MRAFSNCMHLMTFFYFDSSQQQQKTIDNFSRGICIA